MSAGRSDVRRILIAAAICAAAFLTAEVAPAGEIEIAVEEGEHWEHSFRIFLVWKVTNPPQMAFWLEDSLGRHVTTLYVTRRTALQDWRPFPGEKREEISRPSSLPVWTHVHRSGGLLAPAACDGCHEAMKREDRTPPGDPTIDGITGATPKEGFSLARRLPAELPPGVYTVKAEINHSKDFDDAWPEDAEPGDDAWSGGSMGSGQPSVVWAGRIVIGDGPSSVTLVPAGHGHPSGANGEVETDLSAMGTALDIVGGITVSWRP